MTEIYKDKRLLKISKGNGKFIKLDVGESFKGKYLTWRAEMDEKYNKMKPIYVFRNSNGEEKQLGTSAKKFGTDMAHVIPGSLVQITRLGEGQKTNYAVKVIKAAKMPKDVDEEEGYDEEEEEEEEEETVVQKKRKKRKPVEEDEEEEDEDDDEDLFE